MSAVMSAGTVAKETIAHITQAVVVAVDLQEGVEDAAVAVAALPLGPMSPAKFVTKKAIMLKTAGPAMKMMTVAMVTRKSTLPTGLTLIGTRTPVPPIILLVNSTISQ
jgi:hypothetical protein